MSQEILKAMAIKGYIERVKKGPDSYSILTNKDKLISDWLKEYHFDLNIVDNYYTPDKDILKEIKLFLKKDQYALTLHTGANLITSFVRTEEIFIYMNLKDWEKDFFNIRQVYIRGLQFHKILGIDNRDKIIGTDTYFPKKTNL